MAQIQQLYFGGDMEAAIPLSGQVVGRIDSIKTARDAVQETMAGFHRVMRELATQYAS
jgi:enoyl-[acyl-carrier protein] reductase II